VVDKWKMNNSDDNKSNIGIRNDVNNNKRASWNEVFMNMLEPLTGRCACLKLKASAIITKGTRIIANGYNGTFHGAKECSDYWKEVFLDIYRNDKSKQNLEEAMNDWFVSEEFRKLHRTWSLANEIHAEANALSYISKDEGPECTMYSMYSPCDACAKSIIGYGIKTVYYKYKYKHGDNALSTLKNHNVKCEQI
jgi:deoxycytidylate deaminase